MIADGLGEPRMRAASENDDVADHVGGAKERIYYYFTC